jgi:zona occludens toxin (predicted ATPase)
MFGFPVNHPESTPKLQKSARRRPVVENSEGFPTIPPAAAPARLRRDGLADRDRRIIVWSDNLTRPSYFWT